MTQWLIQLGGHKFDLLDLAERVSSADVSVIEEEGKFYLRSEALQSCTDAAQVQARAQDILSVLNGAAAIHVDGYRPVSADAVVRVDDGGERHVYKFASATLEARGRLTVKAITSSGNTAPPAPSKIDVSITCAANDDTVNRVLTLCGSLPHTWRNLYIVLEVIEDDVGGEGALISKNWNSKIKLFKQTANSYRALGSEARHGTLKYKKPAASMTLAEAKTVVISVLREWLAAKCP